jgi:hypothetical protein
VHPLRCYIFLLSISLVQSYCVGFHDVNAGRWLPSRPHQTQIRGTYKTWRCTRKIDVSSRTQSVNSIAKVKLNSNTQHARFTQHPLSFATTTKTCIYSWLDQGIIRNSTRTTLGTRWSLSWLWTEIVTICTCLDDWVRRLWTSGPETLVLVLHSTLPTSKRSYRVCSCIDKGFYLIHSKPWNVLEVISPVLCVSVQ